MLSHNLVKRMSVYHSLGGRRRGSIIQGNEGKSWAGKETGNEVSLGSRMLSLQRDRLKEDECVSEKKQSSGDE